MKQGGFSLIELMVVISIGAVVLTMAAPSFQTTLANNRILAFSNDLVTGMNFTRTEAIKRASFVSICASSNQQFCTGTDWSQGWIIFVDSGVPGQVDGSDVILRTYASTSNDININLGGATYIRYGGSGFLAMLSNPNPGSWVTTLVEAILPGGVAEAAGTSTSVTPVAFNPAGQTITICGQNNRAKKGRAISISASGRVSAVRTNC